MFVLQSICFWLNLVWTLLWWFCSSFLSLLQESGCAFFAALCKEDLNYSQPMNQLTLICPLLNLNPKKLFCLDFGLGRPLALSVGQLADRVVGVSSLEPIGVRSVRFGIGSGALWHGRGYGGTHCLDVHGSTLAWNLQVAAWRISNLQGRRSAPAPTAHRSDVREGELGLAFQRMWQDYTYATWNLLNWMNWKNCIKK